MRKSYTGLVTFYRHPARKRGGSVANYGGSNRCRWHFVVGVPSRSPRLWTIVEDRDVTHAYL